MLRTVDLDRSRRDHLASAERIFTGAFGTDDCLAWSAIEQSMDDGTRVARAAVRDGTVVGVAVTVGLADVGVTLLEYLAVDAVARSSGVGGLLLRSVLDQVASYGNERLVLQVEHPDYGDDRATRRRRVRFYARHGARIVDLPADRIVPHRRAPGTVPMLLLEFNVGNTEPLRGPLLAEVLAAIWRQSYGRDTGDADLRKLTAALLDGEGGPRTGRAA